MTTKEILEAVTGHLSGLKGRVLDVVTLSKPASAEAAANLAKIVSKLSPFLGNIIEFRLVDFLNLQRGYKKFGTWKRQDPDFPDAIFEGSINPQPGLDIKAWFPFSTEITARFKISQTHFVHDSINLCIVAWVLDNLVFGMPRVIDVCIVSGRLVAAARDGHYHNPPDYLVREPEDTTARTRNLQQTNVNGYKWQDTPSKFKEAERIVTGWGANGRAYSSSPDYQHRLRDLLGRFRYRLDTNFAKMDRIVQGDIESFKDRVLETPIHRLKISEWSRLFYEEEDFKAVLKEQFNIGRES